MGPPILMLLLIVFSTKGLTASEDNGKSFSLFNVVTFKNVPCRSSSTTSSSGPRNGTCYTLNECSELGGSSAGSCASGFGVCCLFATSTCGSTVSHNCSYVRNAGFPESVTGESSCTYTVTKCDPQVCTMRLDFESFNLLAGTGTIDALADCQDMFTIGGLSSPANIPTICGSNAGQHIYVELGTGVSDSAELKFEFADVIGNRQFEMKVTQIICNSRMRPPEGCLQWIVGTEGRIETFNFAGNDNHLNNQRYNTCIRQEMGFCCVEYSVCSDPNSFSLFSMAAADLSDAKALVESSCSLDWIEIEASSESCSLLRTNNRYCGNYLADTELSMANAKICDCTPPFYVGVRTNAGNYDSDADGVPDETAIALVANRGVCLNYFQVPCQSPY